MKTFEDVLKELKQKRILVANRGISARRICRSVRERFDAIAIMTATSIDEFAPAAASAQELLLLGEDPLAYLDLEYIISQAKRKKVLAIHPGWGFASEDERFPRLCKEAGIVFIGSTAEAMNLLGNKVEVREIAKKLGIPVVPGSVGSVDIPNARKVANEIGFPIMLKAEGGGGGKGIVEVHNEHDLEDAFFKASTMANASFGNPRLFVEKFLDEVHHIEIQVIADKYGNVFTFDERDCTIQRNNQKLIEVTPSPWKGMTPELRERLKKYAHDLVAAVKYDSVCTVEFLVLSDGTPYLIEVNTRLQVEHGVTESRYGIDLVEEQIAVAFGSELRFKEGKTIPSSVAMQVRINCEDPQNNFAPNGGLITRYVSPGGSGVRLDSNLSAGYEFPSSYDSAAALLIAYGQDWDKVLGVMNRALSEYVISGVKTTIPFYRRLLHSPLFKKADFTTRFIAQNPELLEYADVESESERLAKLVADISAKGYNSFVQLGEYRTIETPRMPKFEPFLPSISNTIKRQKSLYPQDDRRALMDYIRDSKKIHFTDTTCRDVTQSNSGNRFRLAEDTLVGPYLDNCDFFSLETGGGAHFHVAMLANMTYPFTEAAKWNKFAPKTLKQILIRSTNILGYKPQPANIMRRTGEMICEHFQVVRCFDFLNHAENMLPFAQVAMSCFNILFQPALSLSYSQGFSVQHYLEAAEEILRMMSKASGKNISQVTKEISLGLKDMAGVCPPRFMTALVTALKKKWPDLVLQYHRHYTDGLFVPSVGAAAKAGVEIVDTAIGASVRSYGQGDVLATAAYLEEELGLEVQLDRDRIRECNFVLKQIMPYYDRYAAPYFQGIDHDVLNHGMPGGATSSSQEGALKQGYIHLLPHMLKYLSGVRKIVKYHDVTPGSQITWNTAFLAVTAAYNRNGLPEVERLLDIVEKVGTIPEKEQSPQLKKDRLIVYQACNDAFRNLLLGDFGRLPLGFPADWVYHSAFGDDWKDAIRKRTKDSPLVRLIDPNLDSELEKLREVLHREPAEEEFVMYLNQPADALNTISFKETYGDPNFIPLDVWFEGLPTGKSLNFNDSDGKPHNLTISHIHKVMDKGLAIVRYVLDSEIITSEVFISPAYTTSLGESQTTMAQINNPYHVAAPSNGDLWVIYVKPGDVVTAGQPLFNISIMKQEKAVFATVDGLVKEVYKEADFNITKKMVPVKEGELIVELIDIPHICTFCLKHVPMEESSFCPFCGYKLEKN